VQKENVGKRRKNGFCLITILPTKASKKLLYVSFFIFGDSDDVAEKRSS